MSRHATSGAYSTGRLMGRCLKIAFVVTTAPLLTAAHIAGAQTQTQTQTQTQAEVVRGRITDDSAHAIDSAIVIVTRGPDRLVEQDTTDASGNYSLRFDPGTGDYLVYVSATGYASARRRVQRAGTEHELVANFTLKRDLAQLKTIVVRAAKPERATDRVVPFEPEVGASEKWQDGVEGAITPNDAGSLNAVAGTMSNITMNGGAPSVLGSGAESNLTTLNGMGMAAGTIPRAANTEVRVTSATFDATRGGFTGVNTDVRLSPGDRMFQSRRAFVTLNPSALQFTDAVGRASGARNGSFRGSIGADGELIRDVMTYNVAADFSHGVSQPATLADAGDDILRRAGIAPDSAYRVAAVATPLGLTLVGRGIPSSQQRDAFSWLGRLDDTRDTLRTRTLTSYATYTRNGGMGFAPLSAPSTASENRQTTLGAQLTLGDYVGVGRRTLTETRLAASVVRNHASPYLQLPSANVLVLSPGLGDGGDGSISASEITLGGGRAPSDESHWTVEGSNQTTWNTNGRRNHFKALIWGRLDGSHQSGISNALGSYSFNSLTDLAAGNASGFSRTLTEPSRSGTVWNAATAVTHQWNKSRYFAVLYGARVEADGFVGAAPENAALASALGVSTNVAPARIAISPRVGFSYTYNTGRDNGFSTYGSSFGTFYRGMSGTIRGGVGEFRDLLQPDILANASVATGLPNGTVRLSCVGAAVPSPDWTAFESDPGTIPTRCLDGSGVFADYAPAVSLISPAYDVPHNWRASLDWTTDLGMWLVKLGALGDYKLSQPGVVSVNFAGVPKFTLADGGRPVYVSPGAIDEASGTVSPVEARRSSAFGSVMMLTSDLRGYGGQLTATVAPDFTRFRSWGRVYTSLSYTLQASRRQYRGFDGAAFGDPRTMEWAASNADARHVFVYSLGLEAWKAGTVTLFARAQSGFPFTPIVQGDVNGDGIGGDRAFIPNPVLSGDSALAGQIRSLLESGSSSARNCLSRYLGEVAPHNGCRGPWSAMLNAEWQPPLPRKWMGRVRSNIYFENVLGGVDQMLHGSNLRGWGSQPIVDPVLLVPHGFDPATRQFAYTVNPRFADTRAFSTVARSPFRVSIDFSINLSVDYNLQQLRRAVEPVKGAHGYARRSADSLTSFYMSRTSDVYKLLLANSDSLFLTKAQTAELEQRDSVYSEQVRAVFIPLGRFLAAHEDRDPGKAELDSANNTQKAYWKVFWQQPELANAILTPMQRDLIVELKRMSAIPPDQREHARWYFQYSVELVDKPKPR